MFSLCFYLLSHKEAGHNNLANRLRLCSSCLHIFFNLVLFISFLLRLRSGRGQAVNPLHGTARFTQPEFIRANSQAGAQLEVDSRSVKQTMAVHSETKQSWQDSTITIYIFFSYLMTKMNENLEWIDTWRNWHFFWTVWHFLEVLRK